tara:strand:- start:1357 stop:1689 length:333 start_codon:yes stop_codon:yes gene_type:complete
MPSITMTLPNTPNVSLQANTGDIVYYQANGTTTITRMGECTAVDRANNTVTCEIDNTTAAPSNGDFIFFSKENIVNTTGLIGYHALVQMSVTSTSQKELFAVTSESFISS